MQRISIRLDDELYQWLTEKVASIRPETSINKYVNWLIEREWNRNRLVDPARPYNITSDGQIEGGE